MKVVLVTKSADNPASRYRADPILARLGARGDEVTVFREPDLVGQLELLLAVRRADLVLVQRKLPTPLISGLISLVGPPLVFDFDDAIFLRTNGEVSPTRHRRFRAMVSRASLVFAGNEYLAEAARGFSAARIQVLPTAVDVSRYPGHAELPAEPTLVWIGSRSTSRYLHQERAMLEALGAAIPGLRLKVIAYFELRL
ncbi:MAG: hypothetical protein O3B72_13755, partial [Proteobacteria bacterium]|nr:hypothetical protein [Pseudomonadota bacterium]